MFTLPAGSVVALFSHPNNFQAESSFAPRSRPVSSFLDADGWSWAANVVCLRQCSKHNLRVIQFQVESILTSSTWDGILLGLFNGVSFEVLESESWDLLTISY